MADNLYYYFPAEGATREINRALTKQNSSGEKEDRYVVIYSAVFSPQRPAGVLGTSAVSHYRCVCFILNIIYYIFFYFLLFSPSVCSLRRSVYFILRPVNRFLSFFFFLIRSARGIVRKIQGDRRNRAKKKGVEISQRLRTSVFWSPCCARAVVLSR